MQTDPTAMIGASQPHLSQCQTAQSPAPLDETLAHASEALRVAGIEAPVREARMLMAHALGETSAALLLGSRRRLIPTHSFETLIARRVRHEPFAHLVGSRGFWTVDIAVDSSTLVPRADSETLIEALIDARPEREAVHDVLDLGTGTGCLLLAALAEFPKAWGLGIERSQAAARLAQHNARRNGLHERAAILCADWGGALADAAVFDVVISNPPYIPHDDLAGLMAEVRDWEPHAALDGGGDGLDAYRTILPLMRRVLAPDGIVLLEFGIGQASALSSLAREMGLEPIAVKSDLGGVERVLTARVA